MAQQQQSNKIIMVKSNQCTFVQHISKLLTKIHNIMCTLMSPVHTAQVLTNTNTNNYVFTIQNNSF